MNTQSGLLLEDGTWFPGDFWGNEQSCGEVVFNTSMTGYQEIITDPSYCDQIIVMTYPLIGNYGIGKDESESDRVRCKGVIVKEFFEFEEVNGRQSLQHFLTDQNISVLSGVDTRAIVKKIREHGTMKGFILKDSNDKDQKLAELSKMSFLGTVKKCSPREMKEYGTGDKHVALYDFGCKKSILDSLTSRNLKVTVVPYDTSFEKLQSLGVDGVVLSNGPGDPSELVELLPTVKSIQENYPTLGICLGHQLFALANGCKTRKMHFGHRGGNQAVIDLQTNKSYLSSQNHGYDVDPDTIDRKKLSVTHININDKSIEGLKSTAHKAFSVQFHPEANPGPVDTAYIFDDFLNMMESSNEK